MKVLVTLLFAAYFSFMYLFDLDKNGGHHGYWSLLGGIFLGCSFVQWIAFMLK